MFCHREWPRLVGALRLTYRDRELAEEVAQEALERAVRRWSSVRSMEHPGAWVHRVAFNLAASRVRRIAAGQRAMERHGPGDVTVPGTDADHLAVRTAISALDERMRTAVVLRYYLGMSSAEAGSVMGCSGQAVRNLTHRGLRALRETLGPGIEVPAASDEEVVSDVR